jgi:hypothetical protein
MADLEKLSEDLALELKGLLMALLEDGWQLPFRFAVFGTNGAYMVGAYTADNNSLKAEIEAQAGSEFTLPANLVVCDSRGDMARVSFTQNGASPLSVLH